MKTAIILIIIWYLLLQLWVYRAEQRTKEFERKRQEEIRQYKKNLEKHLDHVKKTQWYR